MSVPTLIAVPAAAACACAECAPLLAMAVRALHYNSCPKKQISQYHFKTELDNHQRINLSGSQTVGL